MARKRYHLIDSSTAVDLRDYKEEILEAVNAVVPGKHPVVYADCFEVDVLNQSESVALGRKLSSIKELQQFGKKIETFRLFQGRILIEKTPQNATTE